MKKKILLGLAAIVLVFSLTACGDGAGGGGGGDDPGSLTITGLGDFDGEYALALPWDPPPTPGLLAAAAVNISAMSLTGGLIEDGEVTLKVWSWDGGTGVEPYSGSDKNVKFSFWHDPTSEPDMEQHSTGYIMADFTNGVGEGQWYDD